MSEEGGLLIQTYTKAMINLDRFIIVVSDFGKVLKTEVVFRFSHQRNAKLGLM